MLEDLSGKKSGETVSDLGEGVRCRVSGHTRSTALEEGIMTAIYTFDVFSSLDGYGAHSGNWGG